MPPARAALALRWGGWRGLIIQGKRPPSSPGETTDFANGETEPQSGEPSAPSTWSLCLNSVRRATQFRGLKGYGIPKGLFLLRGPDLFRGPGSHPAEGLLPRGKPGCPLLSQCCVLLTEETSYGWQEPFLPYPLPCLGTHKTKAESWPCVPKVRHLQLMSHCTLFLPCVPGPASALGSRK